MSPELKSNWLAALRSGKYKQGNGNLNANGKMCCLGVLCDVAGFEWEPTSDDKVQFKCRAGEDYIQDLFILEEELKLPKHIHDICYSMNDGTFKEQDFPSLERRCYSFSEIADFLEDKI